MYVCAEVTETGACARWTEFYGLLPPLSIDDSMAILSASALVLAVAWGVGVLYRLLFWKTR